MNYYQLCHCRFRKVEASQKKMPGWVLHNRIGKMVVYVSIYSCAKCSNLPFLIELIEISDVLQVMEKHALFPETS